MGSGRRITQPDAPVSPAVRIGRLLLEGDPGDWDLPAFVPFLGHNHLFITGADNHTAHGLVQSTLLRLLLTCPPGAVQMTLLKPGSADNLLSGFLHLPPELTGGRIHVRGDEISAQLSQLSDHIAAVAQNRLRGRCAAGCAAWGRDGQPSAGPALRGPGGGGDEPGFSGDRHSARPALAR